MAYDELKEQIKQVVKTNGNQEITGVNMQSTLLQIVDNIPEQSQELGYSTGDVISQKEVTDQIYLRSDDTVKVEHGAISSSIEYPYNSESNLTRIRTGFIKVENLEKIELIGENVELYEYKGSFYFDEICNLTSLATAVYTRHVYGRKDNASISYDDIKQLFFRVTTTPTTTPTTTTFEKYSTKSFVSEVSIDRFNNIAMGSFLIGSTDNETGEPIVVRHRCISNYIPQNLEYEVVGNDVAIKKTDCFDKDFNFIGVNLSEYAYCRVICGKVSTSTDYTQEEVDKIKVILKVTKITVVQELGYSAEDVISQKEITDQMTNIRGLLDVYSTIKGGFDGQTGVYDESILTRKCILEPIEGDKIITSEFSNIEFGLFLYEKDTQEYAKFTDWKQAQIVTSDYNEEYITKLMIRRDTNDSDWQPFEELVTIKEYSKPEPKEDSLKILLVGSSFGINTIHNAPYFAKQLGLNMEFGNVYSGGIDQSGIRANIERGNTFDWGCFTLNSEWSTRINDISLQNALTYYEWDVIVLQRGAYQADSYDDTVRQDFEYNVEYIKSIVSNNPVIGWNDIFNIAIGREGHYPSPTEEGKKQEQKERYTRLGEYIEELNSSEFIDFILPSRTAIANARSTFLQQTGADTMHDISFDGMHLDYGIGCTITGLCFVEYLCRYFGLNSSIRTVKQFPQVIEDVGYFASEANFSATSQEMGKAAIFCALAALKTSNAVSEKLSVNFPLI